MYLWRCHGSHLSRCIHDDPARPSLSGDGRMSRQLSCPLTYALSPICMFAPTELRPSLAAGLRGGWEALWWVQHNTERVAGARRLSTPSLSNTAAHHTQPPGESSQPIPPMLLPWSRSFSETADGSDVDRAQPRLNFQVRHMVLCHSLTGIRGKTVVIVAVQCAMWMA